jgi:3-dehydroquinate synthase
MPIDETLQVELAGRGYPIHIGRDLEQDLHGKLEALRASGKQVAALVDASVAEHQNRFLSAALGQKNDMAGAQPLSEGAGGGSAPIPSLAIPSGETSKSVGQLSRAWDFLAASGLDRGGAVLAIGGGVTGDLAGFAAASYLRGVDFVQVPTTLLAMVDSSVGGKTGINIAAGKNLVGAFHQPGAVFIDLNLLRTLPPRQFAAGMAEVIKYGLLGDRRFLEQLIETSRLDPTHPELVAVVAHCCRMKAEVVLADERETAGSGGRALLNLGHTFAHAIEQVAGYGAYLHGEAVAIGLVLAARLSMRMGHAVTAKDLQRLLDLLARYELPRRLHAPLPLESLLSAMQRDKKTRAGKLRFVVLRSPGNAVTADDIPPGLAAELWLEAGARQG